ncbi:MAG: potassium transporter Kup [Rickettsiales bacterium]|nr:potassium transporter Kup [Rickettsiales bacterium]
MSAHPARNKLFALTLGSIGVVYGDIGTSPLYAFRESLAAASGHGGQVETGMVLGVLSLIIWALIIVVTLKYVVLILRSDNQGEGGILSLMTLAQKALGNRSWILLLGMLGCALFYGDAIITPAISVLSAVEGLKLVTDEFSPYVIPISLAIIILLFSIQRKGTERIARYFGPIMALWFMAMAAGGLIHINDAPEVWKAINPAYACYFLMNYGMASFIALGAVFLAVTGAEALYADLGHFGKKPIRLAWIYFVMPCLLLNYFGQAALVLSRPEAATNSFFLLYPEWALLPMVILATFATVIASQAVITGAYSLTHQAIQLGLLPRLEVKYTSSEKAGQIFMPQVNIILLLGVLLLIEIFKSSSNLASAYGIAVTGTMVITAILAFVVVRYKWHWHLLAALAVIAPLFVIDLAFFGANLTKLLQGGFMPILLSLVLLLVMRTWIRGSHFVQEQTYHEHTTMAALIKQLSNKPCKSVPGMAIFLTSSVDYAPSALLQNLKHNKVLHEQNIILTINFANQPYVKDTERVTIQPINDNFKRVFMSFGYMEIPDVMAGIQILKTKGIEVDSASASFFISRRNVVPSAQFGMPVWRDRIYIVLANNASDAADYFNLPLDRVVELGIQVTV